MTIINQKEPLIILPCDREAAAALYSTSKWDKDAILQAFAAHRMAERERVVKFVHDSLLSSAIPENSEQAITDLATAIEQGAHHE